MLSVISQTANPLLQTHEQGNAASFSYERLSAYRRLVLRMMLSIKALQHTVLGERVLLFNIEETNADMLTSFEVNNEHT